MGTVTNYHETEQLRLVLLAANLTETLLFRLYLRSLDEILIRRRIVLTGTDIGQLVAIAHRIPGGDETCWHREWKAAAERSEQIGRKSLADGHRVSAREALLRASNYYCTAEFYLRDDPASDPEVALLAARAAERLLTAMSLFEFGFERISIPYQQTSLPGYLFRVDDSERARPTIIYNNGFDPTLEESYFVIAAAALARGGHNVFAFDGPGQGVALREQGLVFRPDWEALISPVIDYAKTRPDIASDQITLFGYSMGGYLAARAAAFEPRLAALVLNDGLYDFHAAIVNAETTLIALTEAGRRRALPHEHDVTATPGHLRLARRHSCRTAALYGLAMVVDQKCLAE